MFFIFFTGGVLSSLGKGLTMASVGKLLEARGLKVGFLKLDPYLNVDPGTMNPFEHGEVFVTEDGAETDLDLGHYFRFTKAPISRLSSATAGQIYEQVLKREREGHYLGQTVQVIPHITDAIKARILESAESVPDADFLLIEIGGTVGDIESLSVLEAIRQFRCERPKAVLNIHLTYVPYMLAAGEMKTKPTQHSVQTLRQIGITPDVIVCRAEKPLALSIREKIALFCGVSKEAVFQAYDVESSIYELPLQLREQGIERFICDFFGKSYNESNLSDWEEMLQKLFSPKNKITIALVGKYTQHKDAYKSVVEALYHAGTSEQIAINVLPIDAGLIESREQAQHIVDTVDGILVPGGFGTRGCDGMIEVICAARERNLPFLGICLGMQLLAIEFARHVLGMKEATSLEFDSEASSPIISLMENQKAKMKILGGTMRLGAYACNLKAGSKMARVYEKEQIMERHRHRYEFNNEYLPIFEKEGLLATGILAGGELVEAMELKDHPWMIGVQFHPEFSSTPLNPHPLFIEFIKAALGASCVC